MCKLIMQRSILLLGRMGRGSGLSNFFSTSPRCSYRPQLCGGWKLDQRVDPDYDTSLPKEELRSSVPKEEMRSVGSLRTNQDRLLLRGLTFYGKHGVLEEERTLGQKFTVDMDAWMDLRKAGETDQLEDSVSYASIYSIIKTIVEGPPHRLLESVAATIASDVLQQYPMISDVRVRVVKPHAPVNGFMDFLGIEIYRSSGESRTVVNNSRKNLE